MKLSGRCGLDFCGSGHGPVVDFSEASGFVTGGEFLD
jgi:hypothetical protein